MTKIYHQNMYNTKIANFQQKSISNVLHQEIGVLHKNVNK